MQKNIYITFNIYIIQILNKIHAKKNKIKPRILHAH